MRGTVVRLFLFTLLCLTFTVYLAFTIGNLRPGDFVPGSNPYYTIKATFDDVTGLLPDANVKVSGVRVGKVTGIKVDKGRAVVTMVVKKSLKLPTDTPASIRWRDLLGQRFVYLYPEDAVASTLLANHGEITKTRSVVDLGELFNKLGPIVKVLEPKQVNELLDNLSAALDGNTESVRAAIDNLAILTNTLASRDTTIKQLIGNLSTVSGAINDRDAQIKQVLENLVALSGTFSANTNILNDAVTQLNDVSHNLGTLLANNRSQVDSILANLSIVTDVVMTKLPTLDKTLGQLPAATRSLFSSARNGEWLNQVLPCGAVGRNPDGTFLTDLSALCTTSPSVATTGGSGLGVQGTGSGTSISGLNGNAAGVDAVRQLLGVG